jgi:hypothetical protein
MALVWREAAGWLTSAEAMVTTARENILISAKK